MADEPPIRNPTICIELGERPVLALMTREDWDCQIRHFLAPYQYQPETSTERD